MKKQELWMQDAFSGKPRALHRQLGIPQDTKIPKTLLITILDADTGDTVRNPTKVGRRTYKVTTLMQQRVNPVITASRFRRKKHKRGRIVH